MTSETLEEQLKHCENKLKESERSLNNELTMVQDKYEEESNKLVAQEI